MSEDPFQTLRGEYLQHIRRRLAELDALEAALAGDADALAAVRRLAHQLRGSGGFYGFPAITAAAARLEELIRAAQDARSPSPAAVRAAAAALAEAVANARLP